MSSSNDDRYIKAAIIGDSGVGKTSIVQTMIHMEPTFETTSTLGATYSNIKIDIDGSECKIRIWDTAGQEKFRSLAVNYFRDAHVIILTFALDSLDSFKSLPSWLDLIKDNCPPDVPVVLAGNKCDLEFEVEASEIDKIQVVDYIQVSAKKDIGIKELFYSVAKHGIGFKCKVKDVPEKPIIPQNNQPEKACC